MTNPMNSNSEEESFWQIAEPLPEPPELSPGALSVLERLGPSPFPQSGFPFLSFLATVYDRIAAFPAVGRWLVLTERIDQIIDVIDNPPLNLLRLRARIILSRQTLFRLLHSPLHAGDQAGVLLAEQLAQLLLAIDDVAHIVR